MTIQTIGPCGIAIFIDEEDLQAAGTKAQDMDLDRAKPIVSTALIEAGLNADGIMEIEAFQNGSSVLIFARMLENEPLFFVFDDFETVISAISVLPRIHSDSSLTYLDGEYYLTIARSEHAAAAVLEEFSSKRDMPAQFTLHLLEHGTVVCQHSAVTRLAEYF